MISYLQIDSLQILLQSQMNMASKCSLKLPQSQHSSSSPSTLDLGFQVHLQFCSTMASKYISKFPSLRCVETAGPSCHLMGIREKEQFSLGEECRQRVRGYGGAPSREEPHKLCASMKARQECVRNYTNSENL